MSDKIVLARCDCPDRHWLARVAKRGEVAGIEYRRAVVGITKSGDHSTPVSSTLAWESLDEIRDDWGSMTAPARCPRGRNYTVDLVALVRGIGHPPVTIAAQHADTIDIRPFRTDRP